MIFRHLHGDRVRTPRLAYMLGGFLTFGLAAALVSQIAHAATSLSQSYLIDEPIPIGSIVSLKKDTADHVVPSTTELSDTIIGVIINDGSSLLTLTSNQDGQAQVATSGAVPLLVSDYSGEVQRGDQITASPIKGVGMKAYSNTKVVGTAQGKPTSTTKQKIKDEFGKEREITLGEVPVLVSVSYHYQQPEKTVIPQAFQNVANTIAGKRVDSIPIIVSGVIFLIMAIAVVSIVYAMIRSSIISIGRNPMAQSAVYRGLIQLTVLVLAIISVAIIAIYMILTRL